MSRASKSNILQPFSNIDKRNVLDILSAAAPVVPWFPDVRRQIKRAVTDLRRLTYGFLDQDDVSTLSREIEQLQDYATSSADIIAIAIGRIVEPLQDEKEYGLFSSIALPDMSAGLSVPQHLLWTQQIGQSLQRHYTLATTLRKEFKQAPKYRKKAGDYCATMLWVCCKIGIRPVVGRFMRKVEKKLGWASLEKSGLLDKISLKPRCSLAEVNIQ